MLIPDSETMKKALAAAALFAEVLSIGPFRRRLEERWPPWLRPALSNGTARYREFTLLASQKDSNGALDPLLQSVLEQDLQQPEGGTLGELLMQVGDLEQNSLDFARLDPETVARFEALRQAYFDIEAALRRPVFSLPEFDLNGPRDGAMRFASRVYWLRRLYFSLTHLTRYLATNGEIAEAARVLETLLLWSKSGLRTPNPMDLPAFEGLQGRVLSVLAEPWALQALAARGGWDALGHLLIECSAGGQATFAL